MNTSIRIQRKRTKGFNMQAQSPDGRPVVSVCRPSKWGNPFKVVQCYPAKTWRIEIAEAYSCPDTHNAHQECRSEEGLYLTYDAAVKAALNMYERYLLPYRHKDGTLRQLYISQMKLEEIERELAGKHLSCFCPLSQPCHVDILLKLANNNLSI